ncbi:hypothetical protein PoB_005086500 [Plakobranchus ocellatus]|uniref:Reverse transcriptase domain-containing protein n=1 Tax=Plakobranchus ocellatus TaxID=259542 RepID=A0AAV4BYY7_9GAST|nr:hypothetical protein PoB_005086500 [Plakobranchus ocellatus]
MEKAKNGWVGESIITEEFEDHEGKVTIGDRTITNLSFADDVDGLEQNKEELASLVDSLNKTASGHGMKICAEKTKLMTNNSNEISTDVRISGPKSTNASFLEQLSQIKDQNQKYYPDSQTTSALTKLKTIWKIRNIALSSRVRLLHTLVISMFLFSCETWTLASDLEKRIKALEKKCFRRLLGTSHNQRRGEKHNQVNHVDLLTIKKNRN